MDKTILNGRYEIIRPIGFGGMAEVYLAHDKLLDRNVAIKMLRDQFIKDKDLLEQFRREAKSAARLIHPYIINIYDVVSDGDDQYIVMEYVEGVTLKEYLRQHRLALNAALEIAVRLADALQHAHSRNIIHCDIKPQNILIDKNLNPKIADFGIAKMVSNQTMVYSSSVMGSVHYISPEQAAGENVTACSDVYSLGVVLFEMLTGVVPFTGDTAVAVAMMHAEKPVPRLSEYMDEVPEGLQQIVDKALAKRCCDRYQNAGELRSDLLALKMKLFPFSSEDYKKDMAMIMPAASCTEKAADKDGKNGATVIMHPVRSKAEEHWQAASEEPTEPVREIDRPETDSTGRDESEDKGIMASGRRVKRKLNINKIMILATVIVVVISAAAHFFFNRTREVLEVPSVVNMTVVEAQRALEEKGFKVELEEKYGDKIKPGLVMEQSPKAGEKRKEGSLIFLTISKGAELKTVPDVVGMSLTKAEQQLENAGYAIGSISKRQDGSKRVGSVLSQSPRALDKAPKGSKIDLVINEGDKTVPNLIGQPAGNADKLLKQAGLALGKVSRVKNSAAKNTIIASEPTPGSSMAEGAKVNITVSDGPEKGSGTSVMGVGSNGQYVDFIVPNGGKEQHVQIYVKDSRGRRLVYDGSQKGGVRLRQKIDGAGSVSVEFYSDNRLIEERNL